MVLAACTSACGGSGASAPSEHPQVARAVPQTDLEIALQIYADSARTPPGFYKEPAPSVGYTTTFHLKNSDIAPAAAIDPVHELCTSDWNEALGWSESVAASQAAPTDLTATDTIEQYFEFVRTPRSTTLNTVAMRVYRCEFLDRRRRRSRPPHGRRRPHQQAPADGRRCALDPRIPVAFQRLQ